MTDQPQREDDTAERTAEKPQATQPESATAEVKETTPEPAAPLAPLENNVHDCALVIEGGAMRASYVSGLVNVLLEQGIYFDYVCGISAGSTVATNYVSRDMVRTKRSFVDFAANPQMGGVKSFLHRRGFFNADYDYLGCIEDGSMPFDWQTFQANPARVRIQAFPVSRLMSPFQPEDRSPCRKAAMESRQRGDVDDTACTVRPLRKTRGYNVIMRRAIPSSWAVPTAVRSPSRSFSCG